MRKYFFGYLFVRIAKLLAIAIVVIGLAYTMFRIVQANVAAESVQYQPSTSLSERLGNLTAQLSETQDLVSGFTNEKPKRQAISGRFARSIETNEDFRKAADGLGAIGGDRARLKDSIVAHFELLIGDVQNKLRVHAASLAPPATASATIAASTPRATPTPQTAATHHKPKTLFSDLTAEDIEMRISTLDKTKQFLTVLETMVENPQNLSKLSESVDQVDKLKRLLPTGEETATLTPQLLSPQVPLQWQPGTSTQTPSVPLPEPRKRLNAEIVADQLEQLRISVRRAVLSSWALDDSFDRARELLDSEQNKCRSATLAVQGIWLVAFGQMAMGVVIIGFVAFAILVLADLTQTLLDTATNTGVIAQRDKPE